MGSGRNLAGTADAETTRMPWAQIGAAAFASGALIAAVAIPGIRATTSASAATAVDEGIARGIMAAIPVAVGLYASHRRAHARFGRLLLGFSVVLVAGAPVVVVLIAALQRRAPVGLDIGPAAGVRDPRLPERAARYEGGSSGCARRRGDHPRPVRADGAARRSAIRCRRRSRAARPGARPTRSC